MISACLFWGLDSYGVLHNNEGLYAEIAREMIVDDHYIIPYLNGVPYIEKPPLLYWLITLSYRLFGINEFSARLIPAIFGAITIIMCAVFAHKNLSKHIALLTMLIMGTSMGYCVGCRMVMFDSVLTFFLTSALFGYWQWFDTNNRTMLRWGYACLAAAVLTKGLVALILAGCTTLLHIMITQRSWRLWLKIFDGWGLLLFALIVIPWHYQAAQIDPHFPWFYFINEHVLRFLGQREPHDYYSGPWYYYTYRVIIYFIPWSLFLLMYAFKNTVLAITSSAITSKKTPSAQNFVQFMGIWFISFFIFFSLSRAKANYYLLAAFPPLAIIVADYIDQLSISKPRLTNVLAGVFPIIFMIIASILLCVDVQDISIFKGHHATITIVADILKLHALCLKAFVACGIIAILGIIMWPRNTSLAILNTGITSVLVIILATLIIPRLEDHISARNIVRILHLDQHNVCLYRDFEKISSFTFYSQKPLTIVDSRSNDLLYGQRTALRPDLFLTSQDVMLHPEHCSVFIVHNEQFKDFQQQFPGYNILYRVSKILVLTKKELNKINDIKAARS